MPDLNYWNCQQICNHIRKIIYFNIFILQFIVTHRVFSSFLKTPINISFIKEILNTNFSYVLLYSTGSHRWQHVSVKDVYVINKHCDNRETRKCMYIYLECSLCICICIFNTRRYNAFGIYRTNKTVLNVFKLRGLFIQGVCVTVFEDRF